MEKIEALIDRFIPRNKRVRMLILALLDVLTIVFASYMGLFIRFDLSNASIPTEYRILAYKYLPFYIVTSLIIFIIFHMYSFMWAVAGIREAALVVIACGFSTLVQIAGMTFLDYHMHRSYYLICFIVLTAVEVVLRLSLRIWKSLVSDRIHFVKDAPRIMICGAGESGNAILKELNSSEYVNGKVVCFIDDDVNKHGKLLNGIKVEGGRECIADMARKYKPDYIYIAMPSATAKERKRVIEEARKTGINIKVLPGVYQLINGEVSISRMRDVQIEDLLGRDTVKVNLNEVVGYIKDKTVLVTGGGGSIGSELVRQISAHHPKKLIVFDIYENNIYDLQQELKMKEVVCDIEYLIGSVRNTKRLDQIFSKYRPNIVFHAAAHKHVPLMEDSPCEAIKNNVFGTLKTAKAADKYGVERFVLISTDKAVNPTNVMGASKRMCEMVIQTMARQSKCNFVAVRFGNVLGSNGSVIPLFREQIKKGGPVTVTHPDIIRYFMTIPEAVSLVLQAGAYARGGEIFVLNMGEPVKILDLAKNLIRLSGYEPDVDIPIEFTGLRPGEKLYEEMLMSEEGLQDTPNKMIHIGKPIDFDIEKFKVQLEEIKEIAEAGACNIREEIKKIVPTYEQPEKDKKEGK